jgi:hypothetical protein
MRLNLFSNNDFKHEDLQRDSHPLFSPSMARLDKNDTSLGGLNQDPTD